MSSKHVSNHPSINFDSTDKAYQILPRTPRKRKRPSSDRGLPEEAEIFTLATEYLLRQRKHWPEIVAAGLLPEPTPEVIIQMVADFQARHRTGEVAPEAVAPFAALVEYLGGSYGRYSCDNSKPISIVDQTNKNLDKSASERRFIPWAYVFADYSVSGLTTARSGYTSYKKLLKDPRHNVETTYIDDFTRASRDQVEWLKLAHFIWRLKRRLIGSSDGFDLNSPQGELMMGMFGLVSKIQMSSLKQKVKRGMNGSAERGTVLGKLPFWLDRRIRRDDQGRDVVNSDGTPVTEPCLNELGVQLMKEIVEMYIVKKLPASRISRILNERNADGWNRWTANGVLKYLRSEALAGILIWNRTSSVYDPETERYIKVENPRSEWKIRVDPSLAILSKKEYQQLQQRLNSRKRTVDSAKKPLSRNEACASTLFSGTLFCGYCEPERELKLNRSGTYKVMACLNGVNRIGNCGPTSNKSVRIIETALLECLMQRVLTEENITRLVAEGNAYLAELASRPPAQLKPLNAEIRRLREKTHRLVLDAEDEEDRRVRADYRKRSKELHELLAEKIQEFHRLAPNNGQPLKPLDEATLRGYLSDIRGLLNQEVPAAAEAIRCLTGRIKVTQRPNPARKCGATWIAHFQPNLPRILAKVAKEKDCPDSCTLEYLCGRIWTIAETVEIPIEFVCKYERLARQILADVETGMTRSSVIRKYNLFGGEYAAALDFARSRKRRKLKSPKARSAAERRAAKPRRSRYKELSPEVARLRDVERLSFSEIARRTAEHDQMVYKAYEHAHPEIVKRAVEEGHSICRDPKKARLRPASMDKLIDMLRSGRPAPEIAASIECSQGTVYRIRARELKKGTIDASQVHKGREARSIYKSISAEVARRRDKEHLSFAEIGRRIGVCDKTVKKAYDYAQMSSAK